MNKSFIVFILICLISSTNGYTIGLASGIAESYPGLSSEEIFQKLRDSAILRIEVKQDYPFPKFDKNSFLGFRSSKVDELLKKSEELSKKAKALLARKEK